MPKLSVFYLPPVIRVPIAKRPVNDPFLKFCFLGSILLPTLLGQIILDIQSEVEICIHELLENIYIKRRREVGLDRKIVFFFCFCQTNAGDSTDPMVSFGVQIPFEVCFIQVKSVGLLYSFVNLSFVKFCHREAV